MHIVTTEDAKRVIAAIEEHGFCPESVIEEIADDSFAPKSKARNVRAFAATICPA